MLQIAIRIHASANNPSRTQRCRGDGIHQTGGQELQDDVRSVFVEVGLDTLGAVEFEGGGVFGALFRGGVGVGIWDQGGLAGSGAGKVVDCVHCGDCCEGDSEDEAGQR